MKNEHEQLVQLLLDQAAAYRSSVLERAHKFREILRRSEPSFYRHLLDAMRGEKRRKLAKEVAVDRDVEINPSFELGLTLTCEHKRYVGCAFALCVDGTDLKGNASLELPGRWRLVTNEAWPTRVEPFIRRGRPLGAALHIRQLENLASQEGVTVPPGVLEAVFLPIDARLHRVYRAVRGSS